MKYTRWLGGGCQQKTVQHLMDAGYPYLVSSVLATRGVSSVEEAAEFLERDHCLAHSPLLMKDMATAVERITEQRMPDGRKMHADLVRSSRFQFATNQRKALSVRFTASKNRPMCHGFP